MSVLKVLEVTKVLLWMLWPEDGMTEVVWFHFVHVTGSWKVLNEEINHCVFVRKLGMRTSMIIVESRDMVRFLTERDTTFKRFSLGTKFERKKTG